MAKVQASKFDNTSHAQGQTKHSSTPHGTVEPTPRGNIGAVSRIRSGEVGAIENKRPLWLRVLSSFLAIWIALSVVNCMSGCINGEGDGDAGSSTGTTASTTAPAQPIADTQPTTEKRSGKTISLFELVTSTDSAATLGETSGSALNLAPGATPSSVLAPTSTSNSDALRPAVENLALPSYAGSPAAVVNANVPLFDAALIARAQQGSFDEYLPLDDLGRATCALACAGPETMPEGERDSIGHIRPSGFALDRYDWVDGKYLYNRCHLVGWQIAGENANVRNLITGTRHMNTQGMLPYEEQVANYIESTGNHVLYRATPIYQGEDLVARGVLLEARSVEDAGSGLTFCVFCFNVEPGVSIDYATGNNAADGTMFEEDLIDEGDFTYILNTNTKRIHYSYCSSVDDMKEKNKQGWNGTVDEAIAQGYVPCGRCNPR